MAAFAETIKKRRLDLGLTQQELGRKAGVEGPYISQIEKGEKVPSMDVAARLAEALELDREEIISMALKEKAPESAKDLFMPPGRFPRLRQLILSRCRNRSHLEPEIRRASFSRVEESVLRLLMWGLVLEGHLNQADIDRVLTAKDQEEGAVASLISLLQEKVASYYFNFQNWSLELTLTEGGTMVLTPSQGRLEVERPGGPVAEPVIERIPVVGMVEAGGGGFYDDQGYPVGQGMYTVARPYDVRDVNAYGVEVSGDSMVPRLYEKDVVVASPAKSVVSGDLAVVRLSSDEVTIKRVRFRDELIILESVNPAYEPRILSRDEVKFMHKVVWIKPR